MFQIITDSTSDMSEAFYSENNIVVNQLSVDLDGEIYGKNKKLDIKHFYECVRNGSLPVTAQVNPEDAKEGILKSMADGSREILYIAFSSKLSGSYQSAVIAANDLKEEYPDLKIRVIDSLSAAIGEGILVYEAVRLRKEGKSFEETADYIESHVTKSIHLVCVDDLFHLQRGGRLSKSSAVFGSILQVKPILRITDDGTLEAFMKVRGRQKSLATTVDLMEERLGSLISNKDAVIGVSHGDCEEEAKQVAEMIREKYGFTNIIIDYLGPVTGSHAGPGTILVSFMGEVRK